VAALYGFRQIADPAEQRAGKLPRCLQPLSEGFIVPGNTKRSFSIAMLCMAAAVTAMPGKVIASDRWRGDFETGDISQWNSPINPAGLSVVSDCTRTGKYAGKITLTGAAEFLWNGDPRLNRSELHWRGPVGSTDEGKETFFGFSFYLPKAFTPTRHEFAYWESDKTWQQVFRFNITGTELSLQESAAATPLWTLPAGATPGVWHDVALHIHWSSDASKGAVQVWFDGKDMGRHHFSTLPGKEALMFTQIGILRSQQDVVEEMLIDDAYEAGSLVELLQRMGNASAVEKTCG
jgi:hypothetical protein